MLVSLKRWLKPTRSRLSLRIVFYVFVSVVVIETIILIPSTMNREKELLDQLHARAWAKIETLLTLLPPAAGASQVFDHFRHLQGCSEIVGGTLYDRDGSRVGSFGEPPTLSFVDITASGMRQAKSPDGRRIDTAWRQPQLKWANVLVLRLDTTAVKREVMAFILRIAGLVLIISIFVTVGAWSALHPIVVTPILRLRKDLVLAGEAISNNRSTPDFYAATVDRRDELGDVIAAFNQMYRRISEAVSERRKAEAALQHSLEQLRASTRALNTEMERGRDIQKNFLPATLPRRTGWEFAAVIKPARQVSGDFYDLFELPNGAVGLVIADVCDKGVGAALFMALFRSLIRIFSGQTTLQGLDCQITAAPENDSSPQAPAEVRRSHRTALEAVRLTNAYIVNNHEDLAMFTTLFFGVLDPATGALSYINGGHDPLYILDADGSVKAHLGPTGPAVGVQAEANLGIRQTSLAPGDILFGYTDGVTEARMAGGAFFGEKRLLRLLKAGADSAEGLLQNVSAALAGHIGSADQFDDITMLAVRRLP
ncbi:MAG: SpoIIE family protein phosphatase [Desulfobacterales bacterium]